MTGAAVAATVLALASQHGMHAAAPETEVHQSFAAFAPRVVDVVTGDVVRWHNSSVRPHTVTADDGSFDSGRMAADAEYAHRFDVAGAHPYHCVLHAGMVGEVRVHDVLLRPPPAAASPGRAFPLHGRALLPAGTRVVVEADEGAGFRPAASATVGADGAFDVQVTPRSSAAYRAVAEGRVSPPVQLLVLDREVHASVRRRGRRLAVQVRVEPASPGATVVLQLRLRHRFGWWPVRRAKLDARSRATLRMRLRHAPPARVVLTLPDGATPLARTGALRTREG